MKTPQLPVPELAKKLGLNVELWLKREDLHHYHSHKGRAIPLMINEYAKRQGFKKFVISSSGNAALAALIAIQTHNKSRPQDPLTLTIFVGQKINPKKLQHLQHEISDIHITISQVDEPKQAAFQASQTEGTKLLRQSTDDLALRGYNELAQEISRIENLSAVFIPTSSGTTAQGLHLGFKQNNYKTQIHIAQTSSCHPLVDDFYTSQNIPSPTTPSETSLAGAIVDQVAHRKIQVTEALVESQGYAWIITNEELQTTMSLVKSTLNIILSPNSTLGIAALIQAQKNNRTFSGPVVCLITGN